MNASTFRRLRTMPGSAEQARLLRVVVTHHSLRIETVECLPVVLALVQDRAPRQTRLRAFETQQLEQSLVVVQRTAPFLVVIRDHQRIAFAPCASRASVRVLFGDARLAYRGCRSSRARSFRKSSMSAFTSLRALLLRPVCTVADVLHADAGNQRRHVRGHFGTQDQVVLRCNHHALECSDPGRSGAPTSSAFRSAARYQLKPPVNPVRENSLA